MRLILGSAAFLFLITISACSNPLDINDFTWRFVSQQTSAEVTSHLDGRVFRQFDPSRTADTRKAIVIDFNDGLSLRAQYFEGGKAVGEWSVSQNYYWIEKAHGQPVYRFDFRDPTVERLVPEGGDSVIVTGLTILVRDYFKKDEIQFALLDSLAHLPPPFPVFDQWTRFVEDAAGR